MDLKGYSLLLSISYFHMYYKSHTAGGVEEGKGFSDFPIV